MSIAGVPDSALRWNRTDFSRLVWALVISLGLHGGGYEGYRLLKKMGWWQNVHLPAWLRAPKLFKTVFKEPARPDNRKEVVPLVFLEVSPAQAVPEPPKTAKYYSDKNSKAANPEKKKDSDIPQITGTQTKVPKTEDVPMEKYSPLQPTPPQVQTAKVEEAPAKQKTTYIPGDLAMFKPDFDTQKGDGEAIHERPRTVLEAKALQPENRLAGKKMNQEGGVGRHLEITALDAKRTEFGDYDLAFIRAVEAHWFALLRENGYASDAQGRVVLRFTMHFDGRITDLSLNDNTAGPLYGHLCRRAVEDQSPFTPWPKAMHREVGSDERKIQFTFYYN